MPKRTFLFVILFTFLLGVFVVSAQNVYTDSINRAKEVRNQVEEKTKEEVEMGTGEETTTPTVTSTENQNQGQGQDKEKTSEKTKSKGEEHKSRVAIVVQELVRAADRFEQYNPGIGKEVRIIAQEQTQSAEKIAESTEKIEKRNRAIKFLIGPNYGEIKKVKQELEQNKLRIQSLNQIVNKLKNEEDKSLLQEQIQILESENIRLQDFIAQEEGNFSLFGWLVKLFQ